MKKGYYILLFLLLWSSLLFAQGGTFTSSISSSQVGTGEQFEVDFNANGNATDFLPPDFAGFQILSGPNMSQGMTSVNGLTSYTTGYSYVLLALKEGNFTIGSASANINFRRVKTIPLHIKVVKGQAVQSAQQSQTQISATPLNNSKDLQKAVFLVADIDKSRAYQGEQLTLSYKIYFRVDLLGFSSDKGPDLNGFWNQDVKKTTPLTSKDVKSVTYKGQKFDCITIKQTILYPEHSGDLVIAPFELTVGVRYQAPQNSGDIFDKMFGGEMKEEQIKVKSEPLTVHVMPLPEAGKPEGFSGAVGDFMVNADVDKKELKANETLNYNLKITGKGNLMLINAPAINPPADFEKYDPKTTDNITVDAAGSSGSRAYTYLMIPRHQGDFTFSPPGFSYFNPVTRRYVSLPAKTYSIKVDKGDAVATSAVFNAGAQQDVKLLGKDIRYIKTTSPDLYKDGEGFYGSPGFYFLLFLGPLAFAGALLYRKINDDQNSDLVKLKSRRANKIAAKHLAFAAKQLSAGNKKSFYEAIAKGLYGYLSDKLNIPAADLNKENITDRLKLKGLDDVTINQLSDTIDLCEMARFAPVTSISEQQVFDKAKNTINEIEDKI
jgi:hypothetical protein